MKDMFAGYYSPQEDQLEALWSEALIVLDTNVILDLYRLPQDAQRQLFNLLDLLSKRLWIPHHVALEYQRRRLGVISSVQDDSKSVVDKLSESFQRLRKQIVDLQLGKRGVEDLAQPLIDSMDESFKKLVLVAGRALDGQLDPLSHDPIRDRLGGILNGRVGKAPADQKTVDAWSRTASTRFLARMGPGYKDADKSKEFPTFMSGGLCYEKKFGDFYLWRQMLDQVELTQGSSLIFVTRDVKEDWWEHVGKIKAGPLPELCAEIMNAGASGFWMYTLNEFLSEAERRLDFKLSDQARADIEAVESEVNSSENALISSVGGFSQFSRTAQIRIRDAIDGHKIGTVWTPYGSVSFVGRVLEKEELILCMFHVDDLLYDDAPNALKAVLYLSEDAGFNFVAKGAVRVGMVIVADSVVDDSYFEADAEELLDIAVSDVDLPDELVYKAYRRKKKLVVRSLKDSRH